MFNSHIMAGFECGRLEWNGHDLLETTDHVPSGRMADHYAVAQQHGLLTARDGLPWRHDIISRLRAARDAGMQVIWDLDHYWRHAAPEAYAERVAAAALTINGEAPLWVCPVNEPEIVPMMCAGLTRADAVATGLRILAALKHRHPDVRVLSVDAVPHPDGPWAGTEAFAYQADVIGLNVYPRRCNWWCSVRTPKMTASRFHSRVTVPMKSAGCCCTKCSTVTLQRSKSGTIWMSC